MKKLQLIICVLLAINQLVAQDLNPEKKERNYAMGVNIGATSGLDFSYKLNKSISIQARYGFLKYEQEDFEYEIDGEDVSVDGAFDFSHTDLLLSFGGSLRLLVGVGYFITSNVDVDMSFSESVFIGDIEFTADDIGHILINAEWDQILPYVGIAFGRAVPKSGFGIGLELGAFYDADGPTMSLDATGLIEETKNQQELLQESFKENKFLPNVNLRLSFSF